MTRKKLDKQRQLSDAPFHFHLCGSEKNSKIVNFTISVQKNSREGSTYPIRLLPPAATLLIHDWVILR